VQLTHKAAALGSNDLLELILQLVGGQPHGANLMHLWIQIDAFILTVKVQQFGFLLLHGRIELLLEVQHHVIGVTLLVLFPCLDFAQLIFDCLLGALDGPCEQQDHFDDFFVSCDHLLETLAVFLLEVRLPPVVNIFGTLQHGQCSLVDGLLNVVNLGTQIDVSSLEAHFHLEEGLEGRLVGIVLGLIADSVLHLI